MLQTARLCHVNMGAADEAAAMRTIDRELSRTSSIQSAFNHGMVALRGDWQGRFRGITCPTLVIHGVLDPILPPENGRALAAGITTARYVEIAGLGHAIPASRLSEVLAPILAHLNPFSQPPTS
jgi:pimeloyl-ACP methyl ester carboxylesterase